MFDIVRAKVNVDSKIIINVTNIPQKLPPRGTNWIRTQKISSHLNKEAINYLTLCFNLLRLG